MSSATANIATDVPQSPQQQAQKPDIYYRDTEEYKLIKKLPKRFPKRVNDIYITNKTDFKAQLKRCALLLLEQNVPTVQSTAMKTNEIYLHAMGNAINRALNLALQLKAQTQCNISTYTSTIELEDDLLPLADGLDLSVQYRNVSAIHVKLFLP